MSTIYKSIQELVGRTPLLELTHIEKEYNLAAKILVKLEYLNPAGSVKDRIAKQMIEEAEAVGTLKPGSVIVEPTSGNTGIGLSMIAQTKGYKSIIVMPESMSIERRKLMKAYGSELVLTPAADGMKGAIAKAKEIVDSTPNAWTPGQFTNQANVHAHYKTTGPEIWQDTDGNVDMLIAGVGTGGTITGTGTYLKEQNPQLEIIAVEPADSPVLSGGKPGAHKIQGIGAGFLPEVLNQNIYDRISQVTNEDAIEIGKIICKKEGILVGISSGAAVWTAIEEAKREENMDKVIAAILPDSGDRYLSTALFED